MFMVTILLLALHMYVIDTTPSQQYSCAMCAHQYMSERLCHLKINESVNKDKIVSYKIELKE